MVISKAQVTVQNQYTYVYCVNYLDPNLVPVLHPRNRRISAGEISQVIHSKTLCGGLYIDPPSV